MDAPALARQNAAPEVPAGDRDGTPSPKRSRAGGSSHTHRHTHRPPVYPNGPARRQAVRITEILQQLGKDRLCVKYNVYEMRPNIDAAAGSVRRGEITSGARHVHKRL